MTSRMGWRLPLAGLLYLIVLVLPAFAAGTGQPFDALEHRRWIANDGGPSQVGALAQTADGFLWLGTNDSLYRFDGARFVRFEPRERNTLNIVSALLADGPDLWVGLRFGGMRRIRDGRMTAWPTQDGLPEGAVYGLARGRDGAIWAALDDGLARFDGKRWETVAAAWHYPSNKARAVFTDRDGIVWAASDERLYYLPAGARHFIDSGVRAPWVSQIAQAPDGALWLTERQRGRIHRVVLDQGRIAATHAELDAASAGLLFDRAGNLWITTTGKGLYFVVRPTSLADLDERHHFDARQGLSSDFAWKLHEDADGNLWVGTTAGLDRFRARTLVPAGLPRGANNFALAAGADGSLWAGPSNRAAIRVGADGEVGDLSMPGPVTAAMTDSDGTVWMGGPAGIWRSRGTALARVAALPAAAPVESAVRALARAPDGTLWVSLNRLGLFTLREGRWQLQPAPTSAASQRMPVVASTDPAGGLWFGYRDNLLVMGDASGERRWQAADGLDTGHVTAIGHDGKRTWIGGQRGIGYVEDGRYRALRLPANGLFENLYAIVPVPVGDGADLWLQTKSGIFQLPAAEVGRAMADPAYLLRYRSHDLLGGLANDPYAVLPLPTAVRTGDGRLWFSASIGVAWIDPSRPAPRLADAPVSIEAVSIDGARLPSLAGVQLEDGSHRIVFGYTAPDLSAPERLGFRYRLDGYDTAWHDAGRQREAVYTGLKPGRYTFRVMTHHQEGPAMQREAVYSFEIVPPFYRRAGFIGAVVALAVAALWLAHRINLRNVARRLRQLLEERHLERERIARELHDTLLQGVHGLVLRFQAIADGQPDGHPVRDQIESVLQRADQVIVEGRDRVRALRNGVHDGLALEDALRTAAAEMAPDDGAACTVTVTGTPRPLEPDVRDEAYRIGHEALANAFHHARARHIRVQVDYRQRWLRLSVADDGNGLCAQYAGPQGREDHWGMRGMYERAGRIRGVLRVDSAVGQGTEVALKVPAGVAYLCGGVNSVR